MTPPPKSLKDTEIWWAKLKHLDKQFASMEKALEKYGVGPEFNSAWQSFMTTAVKYQFHLGQHIGLRPAPKGDT
jgi:hypothetical protein